HEFGVMTAQQNVAEVLSRTIDRAARLFRRLRPKMVLVQGDTASAFACAIAGFLEDVPVGHVEAGLRSHDRAAPFPEEVLRVLVDHTAELFFAPTEHSCRNLRKEG